MTATDASATGSTEQPLVLRETRDGVAVLTLNHPARRNTLSYEMLDALEGALHDLASDDAVRAVILAHNGPVFSSGHDIKSIVGAGEAEVTAVFKRSAGLMQFIRQLPKPVIVQVSGLASAAGLQLAASCDLIVAAETATFQTPGVMIGLFCSTPMVPLSRAVPPKKALEMLFTGRRVTAHEAERMGLVSRVVPAPELARATMELAQEIIQYSAYTLGVGKQAFYSQLNLAEPDAYALACETMTRNALAEDGQEGMQAFLEKRPPRFKH